METFVPFAKSLNTYVTEGGSVNVKPEYYHTINMGSYSNYQFGSVGIDFSFKSSRNLIRDFYQTAGNAVNISAANIDTYYSYTIDLSAQIRLSPKWMFSHSANGGVSFQKTGVYQYKMWNGYISERLMYSLTKKQTFILQTTGHSANLELQGRSQDLPSLSTALSYYLNLSLLKKMPMSVSMTLVNPWYINGLPANYVRNTESLRYYNTSLRGNTILSASLNINFSGKQFEGKNFVRTKAIENNDMKASGNN